MKPVTLIPARFLGRRMWCVKARLMLLRVRQSQGVTCYVQALPSAPSDVLVLECKKPPILRKEALFRGNSTGANR